MRLKRKQVMTAVAMVVGGCIFAVCMVPGVMPIKYSLGGAGIGILIMFFVGFETMIWWLFSRQR